MDGNVRIVNLSEQGKYLSRFLLATKLVLIFPLERWNLWESWKK